MKNRKEKIPMENKDNYFTQLKDELIDYGKTRVDLAKITTYEKTARITAYIFAFLLFCFLLFLTLIMLSFTAAHYFTAVTGDSIYGFAIVALIDCCLLLLFWIFRKTLIEKPVTNAVIKLLFENETDEQDTQS